MIMRTLTRLGLVLGLGIAVGAVACGSDDDPEGPGATGGTGGATGGTGGATGGTGGATGGTGGATGGTGGGGTGGDTGGTGGATGGTGGDTGGTGGTGTAGTAGTGGTGPFACNSTIAELRTEATGANKKAVNLKVCDVVVTYVYPAGYFIQDNSATGPAIQVFETNAWTPDVAVGDVIDLHVKEVTSFNNQEEVTKHETVEVKSQGFDVSTIVQNLTVAPSEDLESELVKITGAKVATLAGADGTIDYGTATGVVLRAASTSALCVGATFDILAPVSQYQADHRIQSFSANDFSNIDTTECSTVVVKNWDLEDWTTSNPPPGFIKRTTAQLANYTIVQSTQNHTTGGQYSAAVTWTVNSNVDVATQFKTPVTAGTDYTCHTWLMDNDPAGRSRVFIIWHTSGQDVTSFPGGATGYTADSATWQELTHTATAPATATAMSCGIRFYPVGGATFTTATVMFDDISITP
jgi:hypothetical protein